MNTIRSENILENPLIRHLAAILIIKLVLLTLLWWLFFRLPEGGISSVVDVPTHIAGPAAVAVSNPID